MPRQKIRVLLADDNGIARRALISLLADCPDIEIIGEAVDGLTAVKLTEQFQPDMVIMDAFMPGLDGIEATRILHSEMPQIRVIGLSMHDEAEICSAMRNAGAVECLCKTDPPDILIEAIRHHFKGIATNPAEDPARGDTVVHR